TPLHPGARARAGLPRRRATGASSAARARPLALRARALPARVPRPADGVVHGSIPAPAAPSVRWARVAARLHGNSAARLSHGREAHRTRDRPAAATHARRPARRRRDAVLHPRSDQRDDHQPPRGTGARARAARYTRRGSAPVAAAPRVLYFGTYERDYPRNAQVISCLRRAGVEVAERHVPVWEGREH